MATTRSINAQELGEKLLSWYHEQQRVLPWRDRETPDPYHVWLAEIMLQQTTYTTVHNRFTAFLNSFPAIESLANSDEATVLRHWAGLGYYARARNLRKCAMTIVNEHTGIWPKTEASLRKLPGIGSYTAAAIRAIAFDLPAVAVDANVKRVFARLLAYPEPVSETLPELIAFFQQSAYQHSPRHHLEAWMDFGETVCKARNPLCMLCPVYDLCQGRDRAEEFPKPFPKKPRKQQFALAYWLMEDDQVWLYRRKSKGLLGGMLCLPMSDWTAEPQNPPKHWNVIQIGKPIRHLFTHIDLEVSLYQPKICDKESLCTMCEYLGIDAQAYPKAEVLESKNPLGVPTLIKKILSEYRNFDK